MGGICNMPAESEKYIKNFKPKNCSGDIGMASK
jgi:hypothetical protein